MPKRSPILTEAYGKMLFKCPIISCTRFYQGFENTELRDKHLRQHERAHKCTHGGCDYRELGFPTEVELRRHVEICHNALPEEPTFPNVQRVNLSKALNDAIDRDDVQAVRDICSEMSACLPRQTGFILRAVKRRSISTALVLVELLGTDIEMNHVDSKGRTVLHEAVQIRNDDLFDRILDTEINVEVRGGDRLTPFLQALQQGYFHAIRLLMNHAAVNLIPDDGDRIYNIYYKGIKDAAAAGVDDILKALFSKFVSVCKSCAEDRFKTSISDDLTRILAKAASNRHESTVRLILELAHALDLESMYQGLLKSQLRHGVDAMTMFLMQRYGEAKSEIGKNGKTYGNALANAAMRDDSALVMRLLKDGADIDYANNLAYNALGAAASRGSLSMVSLLVEQGADINAKGGYRGNALYLACRGKDVAVVDFFLERGADVNLQGQDQETALMTACREQSYPIVQSLIEAGADLNLVGGLSQHTALHLACEYPNHRKGRDVFDILLQKGADVNLQNGGGRTVLHQASRNGHKEIVEILFKGGADVNIQDNSGETALFEASRRGYKEIIEVLLQRGADVNLQNESGQTALFVAFKTGNREVVQVLIKAKVDTEVKDSHQRTPLLRAAERGWEHIVHILIDKAADIDSVDVDQQTALLIASREGHVEIVKILIQERADVNILNKSGQTALFIASRKGYVEVVRILLASGANRLEAALSTAFIYGREDVLQLLLKQASRSHQRTAVQMLFRAVDVAGVYPPRGVYDYALSFVCSFGLEESVEILLEEGAKFMIPAEIYDRALELVGSRRYLLPHEREKIAKLLREMKVIVLPD